MSKIHNYKANLVWTGNMGNGTKNYKSYERSYDINIEGKPTIKGSSDAAFLGNAAFHNPEDLFLVSISSCHMLWYLHLCSTHQITVVKYSDDTAGHMEELEDGSGRFTDVTLFPKVTIIEKGKADLAIDLHKEANQKCFIANSLNFEVGHNPKVFIE